MTKTATKPTQRFVLQAPRTLAFSLVDSTKRRYRKELIYVGHFEKRNPVTLELEYEFDVTDDTLKHWRDTHYAMLSAGMEVPYPTEHTENPKDNNGFWRGMEIAPNVEGKNALFGYVDFADAESEKLAAKADVSIFVPEATPCGNGQVFDLGIKHIAATSYPVIPGLQGFQAIALSYAEKNAMPFDLKKLAKRLGVAETTPDAELEGAINTALEGEVIPPTTPTEPVAPTATLSNATKTVAPAVSLAFVNMLAESRQGKINALVSAGRITKAVADKYSAKYASKDACTLALSNVDNAGKTTDDFDFVVGTLADNNTVAIRQEKTGPQTLALSNPTGTPKASIVENAERRAKEAAGK